MEQDLGGGEGWGGVVVVAAAEVGIVEGFLEACFVSCVWGGKGGDLRLTFRAINTLWLVSLLKISIVPDTKAPAMRRIQNTHLQPTFCAMKPPQIGPMTGLHRSQSQHYFSKLNSRVCFEKCFLSRHRIRRTYPNSGPRLYTEVARPLRS